MQHDSGEPTPRLLPEGDIPLDADAVDAAYDQRDDEHDDAVIAADDTGMLAGQRLITVAEIAEGESGHSLDDQ